jgi:hypothetical protein
MRYPLRRLICRVLTLLLLLQPLMAQGSDAVRAGVRDLHSKNSEVRVLLMDGTSVRGRITRIDRDSFALRMNSDQEVVYPFEKVTDVRKQGGGPRKALWIPLAIGGGVLLALCVAPYPLGFLCRSDPS